MSLPKDCPCIWPNCLSEEEALILTQECEAELTGYPIYVTETSDKRKDCRCDPL